MTDTPKEIPPHYAKLARKAERQAGEDSAKKLTVGKVVQGAITLADKEGLANLTIRKLGVELGFTTMAVYRHIVSREELLVLMVDSCLGTPPDSIRQAAAWQQALGGWANELFARYQSHPWVLDLPDLGMPTTPNRILWVEYVLEILQPVKITLQQKLDAALLIDGHVRNIAGITRQGKTEKAEPPTPDWLRQHINPQQYPHFWQALQTGVLEDEVGPELSFGLEVIIKGLEASL